MNNHSNVNFREITVEDAEQKVSWYNDEEVTRHLHYEDKFSIKETIRWIDELKNNTTRYENVIEVVEKKLTVPIGVIGLFDIDFKNKKAGFYITIGEKDYQGRGLSYIVSKNFLKHCFNKFDLEKIYLYTDTDNIVAKNLYEKLGFTLEGKLRNEIHYKNEFISRYYYGMLKEEII